MAVVNFEAQQKMGVRGSLLYKKGSRLGSNPFSQFLEKGFGV